MNKHIVTVVKLALAEDIGNKDISASLLVDEIVTASIVVKDQAIICGIEYAEQAFLQVDATTILNWKVKDGEHIACGKVICILKASVKSIVTAERTALNFLQMLSATATQTYFLVNKIAGTKVNILDTRKTIPVFRVAQKYAVRCGGGVNHRMGLYDCIMFKDNHIKSLGSIDVAINLAQKKYPNMPLIVEVENLEQLSTALKFDNIKRILCDNFSVHNIKLAVAMTKNKYPLEVSGNIDENNIMDYASTGIDYISIGAITKNIRAIDMSLLVN